jgi:hypothetical protein
MNKKALKILICGLALWSSTIIIADADGVQSNTQAGTIEDPVITKSYFEQNIQSKVAAELSKQTITEEKVNQLIQAAFSKSTPGAATLSTTSPPVAEASNSNLTVIKLEPGQILYGGPGTEIIVRTGKLTVTSADDNGIPDVTSGKDIVAGATVELNHLLVVPREGRGIKSDPKIKQDIYVMVRGPYLIMNADGSKVATP